MLSLPQQLLLLACHENKANILNTSLSLGLAGAVLAELLIQNKIRMNGTRLCRRDQVGVAPPAIRDAVLCDGFLLLPPGDQRSEEHTSELQSRFGISYAVFCLKKK